MAVPFDPHVDAWLNARILVAEYGDDAAAEISRRAQHLPADAPKSELTKLLAVVQAVKTLQRAHEQGLRLLENGRRGSGRDR